MRLAVYTDYVYRRDDGVVYAERAFALLQDSYKNRDENLRWLKAESLIADSPWESIRHDPRFTELLRGVGLGG